MGLELPDLELERPADYPGRLAGGSHDAIGVDVGGAKVEVAQVGVGGRWPARAASD